MKKHEFAVLGGAASFAKILPVGQLYFPSWDRYEAAMRGIFERRYYTNQGPLTRQLEEQLQEYLGVRHAICVANATIGLMMAAEALELSGKVVMPSFTFIASAQSLSWAGIEPAFCDVDPVTHQIDIGRIDALLDEQVTAIMGVNLWGGACDPVALEKFASSRGLKLYFDSAHAFGCEVSHTKIGNFGGIEVFSFHATKILSATEGGCLCTNDDELAARLRNIRSSYGAGRPVPVVKTSNGRMSEAQAAIALMSLEDFPGNRQKNESLFRLYEKKLEHVQGIRLVEPAGVTFSNYQYAVCEIDEDAFGLSRDELVAILKAENVNARRYFYPGTHRSIGYLDKVRHSNDSLPVTDKLCATCMQLPIGALVDVDAVNTICGLVEASQQNADMLKSGMAELGQ
jgi:dTDP-4-amino-4,6-dideoxygalactose transaminase